MIAALRIRKSLSTMLTHVAKLIIEKKEPTHILNDFVTDSLQRVNITREAVRGVRVRGL